MATESKYLTECPNTDARIQAVACLNITPAAAGSNVDTLIPVPDGSHILFDSDRDGNWDVYVMRSDGSEVTRLTSPPGSNTSRGKPAAANPETAMD